MNSLLQELLETAWRREAECARAHEIQTSSLREAISTHDEVSVIGDFKRWGSPRQDIDHDASLEAAVAKFHADGACAVSVLTEPTCFGGRLSDVRDAARMCSLPILRKDILVSPEQLEESADAGASAVLLVTRIFGPYQLGVMVSAATALGLEVVLDCYDATDVKRAITYEEAILGINNRDLETLGLDFGRLSELLPMVPPDRLVIAASGYEDAGFLGRVSSRVDAALVG